jgi:cobalamin-dependent methionine synthase I
VAAELERASTSEKPVAADVERAAAGEKTLAAELERAAAGQHPSVTEAERTAAVTKPVAAEVKAPAVAKPAAAEAEHAAASAKPAVAELERAAAGQKPAVAEGWERLARELWDPKVQSKFWLEVFSLATDAWLRSGAFLEFMQYGLQAAIGESSRDRGSMNSGAQPFGEVGGTPRDPAASRKDKKS